MTDSINSFKDLIVWQKAMDLVVEIYEITKILPKEEMFGLVSQLKRCVVSIPSNIAEGKSRGTRKDYRQFLLIALGSSTELETQLELLSRLGLTKRARLEKAYGLTIEVQKMLVTMIGKLK